MAIKKDDTNVEIGRIRDVYTPETIVAGMVKTHGEPAVDVAYENASLMLDDPDVKMIFAEKEGCVWFLAAHARDFVGVTTRSPLAHAIPASPLHMGDGLYVFPYGDMLISIIKKGEMLKTLMLRDTEIILKKYGFTPEQIYDTSDLQPIEWQSYNILKEKTRVGVLKQLAGAVIAICILLGLSATATTVYVSKSQAMFDKHQTNINIGLQQVSDTLRRKSDPIVSMMSGIHQIRNITRQNNGWIEYYKVENGAVSWSMNLPAYVSQKDYAPFSSDPKVKTEITQDGQRIRVVYNAKK